MEMVWRQATPTMCNCVTNAVLTWNQGEHPRRPTGAEQPLVRRLDHARVPVAGAAVALRTSGRVAGSGTLPAMRRQLAADGTVGGLLVAAVFVWGCGWTEPVPPKLADSAAPQGLCLVQYSGWEAEIVSLQGSSRIYRLPPEQGPRPLTWERILWGRISPNGAWVAAREAAADWRSTDLFTGIAIDGRRLWSIPDDAPGLPAISADATKVVYSSGGRLRLFDVEARTLKALSIDGQHPSWSPAGDRIAFDDGVKTRIYELALDTTTDFAEGTEPSWTADGTGIAVRAGANRVDLVDVRIGTRRELIARRHVSVPRWSADGVWMMYSYSGGARSLGEASSEPHQIIVRNTKTAAEGTVGVFYKANPGDYSWVASEQLCRMGSSSR